MARNPYITPRLFAFFRDLQKSNTREWFEANRERYESQVRAPLLAFIDAFAEPLYRISPHFRADARKQGGSLFRIHRDIRFTKDKSPYKTHAGIHFRHERARDVHAPGFYLHLEPGNVFIGAGIWHPERDTRRRIRAALVERPAIWKQAIGGAAFRRRFELTGDSYQRVPADVDADHPLLEDLMRKDFIATEPCTQSEAGDAGFPRRLAASFRAAGPLTRFLCQAVGLDF